MKPSVETSVCYPVVAWALPVLHIPALQLALRDPFVPFRVRVREQGVRIVPGPMPPLDVDGCRGVPTSRPVPR